MLAIKIRRQFSFWFHVNINISVKSEPVETIKDVFRASFNDMQQERSGESRTGKARRWCQSETRNKSSVISSCPDGIEVFFFSWKIPNEKIDSCFPDKARMPVINPRTLGVQHGPNRGRKPDTAEDITFLLIFFSKIAGTKKYYKNRSKIFKVPF